MNEEIKKRIIEKLEELKGCGHPRVYEIFMDLMVLHDKKNTDYASSTRPLGNFERVAEMCRQWNILSGGHEAEKVAFIYMLKQIDAVGKLLGSGQKGIVEDIGKRCEDIAVYSVILKVLNEETKKL